MNKEKIDVPTNAVEGFLNVRDSGKTNMLDAYTVYNLMVAMGYRTGASWLVKLGTDKIDADKYFALIDEVEYVLSLPNKLKNQ